MRKTLIIGLDGLSWITVARYSGTFPFLGNALSMGSTWRTRVMQVVGPPHSAPSWMTIATGVTAEEHGVYDFNVIRDDGTPDRRHVREDVNHPFFWEAIAASGVPTAVFDYYATLPPLRFDCDITPKVAFSLTVTYDEIIESIQRQAAHAERLLRSNDLVMFVSIAPDKAQHISHKLSGSNTKMALPVYAVIDKLVQRFSERVDLDVVVVSDHGLPGPPFYHNTKKVPGHRDDAMVGTNSDHFGPLPVTTMHFADWVLDAFGVKMDPPPPMGTVGSTYSPDEERDVLSRLEELGYV